MSKSVINCSVDMYADDTLMYFCHNNVNVNVIEQCINEDLVLLYNWLDRRKHIIKFK